MMGRLTEIKGGHYLIPAIALAAKTLGRPLTLSVAGDGPEREILLELARKCGVGAEFWGWLDSERRRDVIRHSDLLAVPSLWPEPFGMVGLEAACHGLPAVAFRVGGIPDWLHSGETGELAPGDPPTVTGLADAIVRALCDIEHYRRLCAGAFEFAQRFTLEAHLLKLEEILFAQ
jgi:glycosyltransferase involved in cell wall biosynthesis